MNGKKLMMIVSILIFCVLPAASIFAQYDITDAENEMKAVASAVSDLIGPNLGGMSSLGDPVGYARWHREIALALRAQASP